MADFNHSTAVHQPMPTELLQQLEAYEHLLFEPMTQQDLDALVALKVHWEQSLGDSLEAICVTESLEDFIECCIYLNTDQIEQAYLDLVASVQSLNIPTHSSPLTC